MNKSDKKILLIEPILRGSRLQITSYIVESLSHYFDVLLLTRKDYDTQHYRHLLGEKKIKVFPLFNGLTPDDWYKVLSLKETFLLIAAARKVIESEGPIEDVCFLAIDDYFLSISLLLPLFRKIMPFHDTRFIYIKYRTEFFYKNRESLKLRFKQVLQRLMLRNTCNGAKKSLLLIFDERYTDSLSKIELKLQNVIMRELPDPYAENFNIIERTIAREQLNLGKDDFIILTIGRQNRRKGLDVLLKACFNMLSEKKLFLHIVGAIEDDIRKECIELIQKVPANSIRWDNCFIPEESLSKYFAAADIIALPYSKDFCATSGVLARGAASGKPVIGPDHGIIGYRIKKWNLGLCFKSENINDLQEKIEELRSMDKQKREYFKKNALAFAETCTVNQFKKQYLMAINELSQS